MRTNKIHPDTGQMQTVIDDGFRMTAYVDGVTTSVVPGFWITIGMNDGQDTDPPQPGYMFGTAVNQEVVNEMQCALAF